MAISEAAKREKRSRGQTRSGLVKREAIQKSSMAPPTRSSVTTKGVTKLPAMTILEMGDMRPHIVFAPSMEACPFQHIRSIAAIFSGS